MFFVFGPSGQMYRGGPENLAQIASVRRVQRHQALRTRGQDEPGEPFVVSDSPTPAQPSAPPTSLRAHDAVSAYTQTEQGPQLARQPLSKVRDVMTANAVSVPPDARVNDAWQTLADHKVAQAPVVDAQGRVVGLLLRADMAPQDLMPEPGAVKQAIDQASAPSHIS